MPTVQPGMLIIEDDTTFSRVLSLAMERRGYKVSVASNIDGAIALLSKGSFTHVVLDLKLGDESGLHLLPRIKKSAPDSEVVLLTGYSSIATAVEAIKLGADNYLCKPANADEILAAFGNTPGNPDISPPNNPPSVDRLEWEHIQKVLAQNDANVSATARSLGMHRRTLQRKLNKRPRWS
jgi:two-component system response regulator RegA